MRGKYSQNFLDHTKQSATVALNITAKRITRNPAEQLLTWLVIKLQIELRRF